jgi:hypothetical protein
MHPERVAANAALVEAKDRLQGAQHRLDMMMIENAGHAEELAELRRVGVNNLMTNEQAHARGSGAGFHVVYSSHPDDPDAPPYSQEQMAAAQRRIRLAEKALAAAEKARNKTPELFDVIAGCRAADTRFYHWPVGSNPSLWKGKPIEPAELVKIRDVERRKQLGYIREIPVG